MLLCPRSISFVERRCQLRNLMLQLRLLVLQLAGTGFQSVDFLRCGRHILGLVVALLLSFLHLMVAPTLVLRISSSFLQQSLNHLLNESFDLRERIPSSGLRCHLSQNLAMQLAGFAVQQLHNSVTGAAPSPQMPRGLGHLDKLGRGSSAVAGLGSLQQALALGEKRLHFGLVLLAISLRGELVIRISDQQHSLPVAALARCIRLGLNSPLHNGNSLRNSSELISTHRCALIPLLCLAFTFVGQILQVHLIIIEAGLCSSQLLLGFRDLLIQGSQFFLLITQSHSESVKVALVGLDQILVRVLVLQMSPLNVFNACHEILVKIFDDVNDVLQATSGRRILQK
mmetsp:Transcript_51170/g.112126  ORF Transcript_51170/g.112126 Transcript_51170/m.112126 type:complete len:342 (-) Transcript_51170:622-1647(-)